MRETEKIFINNKFSGYGFKRNHQERVVNRTSTNDTTNTTEIIHKLGQLEDIEEKLGIDLATFFKGKDPNTCFMQITDNGDLYFCGDAYYGHYNSTELLDLIRKLLFMYWELTKEELTNGNS